jgi:type II secretory pathway pseudopilin PulG
MKRLKSSIKRFAFTLAEVLIVLGVVGVVAEMTIPTVYMNAEKQSAVAKLQKFYSVMSQAIDLSEIDHGEVSSSWDTCAQSSSCELAWFNTYLAPYIRYSESYQVTTPSCAAYIVLADGTAIRLKVQSLHNMQIGFYENYQKFLEGTSTVGKDVFAFFLWMDGRTKSFVPYDYNINYSTLTRDSWINDNTYGCKTSANKMYCAGLIMQDGWQIKSDYPYFN